MSAGTPLRLWAACDSITLEEFVPYVGLEVEVSLGLSLSHIGRHDRSVEPGNWPYELSNLCPNKIVQLPGLERSFTAVTGNLEIVISHLPEWQITSLVPLQVLGSELRHVRHSIDRTLGNGRSANCQALGRLSVCGRTIGRTTRRFLPARIHHLKSMCIRSSDPRFGTWVDVESYFDLGSDPDVIDAPVCLADLELMG